MKKKENILGYYEFNKKPLLTNRNGMGINEGLNKRYKEEEQGQIVNYVINFLSKKTEITNEDYYLLKKNLKKHFIWTEGGLNEVLDKLSEEKVGIDIVIETLIRYKKIYNNWMHDRDWWENYYEFGEESEDPLCFENKPLENFLNKISGKFKKSY